MTDYVGLLAIGDPHLTSRHLASRVDDYPEAALRQLAWCLAYARREHLLPMLLGDVFHYPRDNANWLLTRLLSMLDGEVLAICGNHDVGSAGKLTHDDSLHVLVSAGAIRLVSTEVPWRGTMRGRAVVVGGSSWGTWIPDRFEANGADVVWLTHHDITVPGYHGRFEPIALDGIDVVVNGHIHTPCPPVTKGSTTWLTPGNITRVARGASHARREPAALRMDMTPTGFDWRSIPVPHAPYDEVFHPFPEATNELSPSGSAFAARLVERLQAQRTRGAGLMDFIEANADAFEPAVADEIRALAKEVCK